jgi:hypothetical protein
MSRVRVYRRQADGSTIRVMVWHTWLAEVIRLVGERGEYDV